MPITTSVSSSTYQNFDGSNFSTEGVEARIKSGNSSIGAYAGIGTSFKDGSTGLTADLKGNTNYGDSNFSGGFRIRNNINKNSQTVQFRIQPATVTVPIGKNSNYYATPYAATKINYKTGETNSNVGIYSGANFKIGKSSIYIEGQLYDITKINNSTTGVNAGISIPL